MISLSCGPLTYPFADIPQESVSGLPSCRDNRRLYHYIRRCEQYVPQMHGQGQTTIHYTVMFPKADLGIISFQSFLHKWVS